MQNRELFIYYAVKLLHDYNTNTLKSAGLSSADGGQPDPGHARHRRAAGHQGQCRQGADRAECEVTFTPLPLGGEVDRSVGVKAASRRPARLTISPSLQLLAEPPTRREGQHRKPSCHSPTTRIRFHGVAAYEIVTSDGMRILCDPFLDQNPGAATKSTEFDHVDLVIVSHAALRPSRRHRQDRARNTVARSSAAAR